ncbi:hypothetical protein [Thalassovita sp.]|uniref:hypothetical protein n=1 Tax=Thalassovita sp. TaxID=1979401 RepID=UPI002AB0D333|nr:hypothetical protein [Thalassovita sp.]
MDATEHLEGLRARLNNVFDETIAAGESTGKPHYYATCFLELGQQVEDNAIAGLIKTVAAQLESATLFSAFGLYRQAFSALRLALELGLGACHFSVHRLELNEWLDGRGDIKWSHLIDEDKGVLSSRFAKAFFPELVADAKLFSSRAKVLYRELSEFVHGNHETWGASGLTISFKPDVNTRYHTNCQEVFEVVLFTLCCRYLNDLSESKRDDVEFIKEELNYVAPIRKIFGGPEDI